MEKGGKERPFYFIYNPPEGAAHARAHTHTHNVMFPLRKWYWILITQSYKYVSYITREIKEVYANEFIRQFE